MGHLAFGKRAEVVEVDWNRYGRLIGDVYINRAHINTEVVRLGCASVYRNYSDDPVLLNLEALARDAKRGLSAASGNIPPRDRRRG